MINMAALMAGLTSSADRIDLWDRALAAIRPGSMAEVGVWKGEFAARYLRACPFIHTYFMIDPWAKLPDWNKPWNVDTAAFEAVYREALAATDFAGERRRVLRGRTVEAAPRIQDQSLDFAYIDGDHTLRGIAVDLIAMWDKVKPGGFIGGDDLCASIWQHSKEYEPTLVFPFALYFAEAKQVPIYLLDHQQFLIHKTGGEAFVCADLTGKYGDRSLRRHLS